ncbi:MAG: DUF4214 domain-containing protein, partial [Pirellulales bacterium]
GALVRFQPTNQNYISSPTNPPSFTFRAWDQTDWAAPGSHVNINLIGTGGNSAYSAATATATVAVAQQNQPPSFAMAQNYTTTEDDTVVVPSAGKVAHLNNNLISVPNFVFNVSPGLQGESVTFSVQVDANDQDLFAVQPYITLDPSGTTGTLNFQLAPDVFGMATLSVQATNHPTGAGQQPLSSNVQTATLVVKAINDPPTLDPIANQTVASTAGEQQVPLTGITAGLNESQTLIITATSSNTGIVANPTVSYTNPNTTGTLFYTPVAGASGTATITVTVTDNGGILNGGVNTFSQSFTVTVTSNVPTAQSQNVKVPENGRDTILLQGTPANGQTGALTYTITSLPATCTLYQTPDGTTLGSAITAANTVVTNAQNEVIYVPGLNQTANDSFAFDVSGGSPVQTSAPATVSIAIAAPGQLPSFTSGGDVTVSGSSAQTIRGWATNISAGSQASGQPLEFVLTDGNASLFSSPPAIDATTGNLTFTPAAGATGTATLTATLEDTGNGNQSSPVTFHISVVNAPVATADIYVINDSGPSSVTASAGVLSNDTPSSGVTAQVVNPPAHGTLAFNADGSFTYTPGSTFQGYDTFTYDIVLGNSTSQPTTVTLISHEAAVVDKLYHQVLHRAADATPTPTDPSPGLEYWTAQIQAGKPYGIIAEGIFLSPEHLAPIIEQYYQQFLGRPADPGGLQYWIAQWQHDGGPLNVVAYMIGSPEFYAKAQAAHPNLTPTEAWVTSLYERLLNREPDANGLQNWTNQINNGLSLQQVVLDFQESPEAYDNDVTVFFYTYLNRAPDTAEQNLYAGEMEQGETQAAVQAEIIDLPEFATQPPAPPPGSAYRFTTYPGGL